MIGMLSRTIVKSSGSPPPWRTIRVSTRLPFGPRSSFGTSICLTPTELLPSTATIRSLGEQAHLFGGTARNDVDHDDRIAQYVEFDADAAETAVEALLDFDHLLGRYVSRMRVELQQHFADRAFDQLIVVYRIDVGAVQVTVELLEFLQVAGRIVFRVVLCRNKRGAANSSVASRIWIFILIIAVSLMSL